jgi:hypothetical protein
MNSEQSCQSGVEEEAAVWVSSFGEVRWVYIVCCNLCFVFFYTKAITFVFFYSSSS